ncbi:hypothetical protein KKA72_02355 [Patescibacteria group bacterium]|nr:hypothetical protein [Patescibacteria group bacterium]MBU1877161.1 hypothetical protein [Patescibacteria group bacterium]
MKYNLFLATITIVAILFLVGLVVFGVILPEKIVTVSEVTLYDFAPIKRINFSAIGKVVEIEEEKLTIEYLGETLSMNLAKEVKIMIFFIPEIKEGTSQPEFTEPESGSLDDVKIDVNVNIFGTQEKDGTLIAENITIER